MRGAFPSTRVSETEGGYRRGVVMGLTMAEIMLLFVFCLLLVAAGMVTARDQDLKKAEASLAIAQGQLEILAPGSGGKKLTLLVEENTKLARESETLKARSEELLAENIRFREALANAPVAEREAIPEDTWRELELSREIVSAAQEQGISLREVREGIVGGKLGGSQLDAAAEAQAAEEPYSNEDRAEAAEDPRDSGHNWPPIIMLGSDKFRFQTNSAELTPEFRDHLQTVTAVQVRKLLDDYQVDVIEVVGHTDEKPITSTRPSTMDALAIKALHGEASVDSLVPVDNAGLGLARAISVVHALEATELGKAGVKMIPLSAAQLVMPGDEVSDGQTPEANQARRRIEIRVRRSTPAEQND